jgi:hypothetical protein
MDSMIHLIDAVITSVHALHVLASWRNFDELIELNFLEKLHAAIA